MSAFANIAFNTARYASIRPTYPRQLFDSIFKYHEGSRNARWNTVVDLGCGTGQATRELTPFKRIIGVDPSAKMIQQAQATTSDMLGQLEYVQSASEKLTFLEDSSVDLVVSAQAAHWFNYNALWPELARILKPGGSVAFWGYSELRFPKYPGLTPLINDYCQGTDSENSLGPYWEQPGRSILVNHFRDVPSASDTLPKQFSDTQRTYYTAPHHTDVPSPRPVILSKSIAWNDLLSYLRTFSSLQTYHERFPDDLHHSDGDIAVRFWRTLMQEAGIQEGKTLEGVDQVHVEWPMVVLLFKKL